MAPAGEAQYLTNMVKLVLPARPTMEGAGVRLVRTIASPSLDYVDPFLLLDEFRSDDPADYLPGFPWHPHRGIETVTYMIRGQVEHGDSLGNSGVIGPGDAQWMTAGSGIVHQEMPHGENGRMWGMQLWVNLPRERKMCSPRYQDIPSADIPTAALADGATARVVCGSVAGATGPVTGIDTDPLYLDVQLEGGSRLDLQVGAGYSAFCYILEGSGSVDGGSDTLGPSTIVVLEPGQPAEIAAGTGALRLMYASGRILDEPVARGGPFVMNTREEIDQAWREYQDGTFLR